MPSEHPQFVYVWVPEPITPQMRKLIGEHERLHLQFVKGLSREDVEYVLSMIVAFEKGESDTLSPIPPKKYYVHWGFMQRRTSTFRSFELALAFFAEQNITPFLARLLGEGADADCSEDGFREVSDGLTDEERERVEAVANGVSMAGRAVAPPPPPVPGDGGDEK